LPEQTRPALGRSRPRHPESQGVGVAICTVVANHQVNINIGCLNIRLFKTKHLYNADIFKHIL